MALCTHKHVADAESRNFISTAKASVSIRLLPDVGRRHSIGLEEEDFLVLRGGLALQNHPGIFFKRRPCTWTDFHDSPVGQSHGELQIRLLFGLYNMHTLERAHHVANADEALCVTLNVPYENRDDRRHNR